MVLSHHQNSKKRLPREEERMKIVAGERKKKSEILGSPGEGGSGEREEGVGERGSGVRGSEGERPKSWTHRRKWAGFPHNEVHCPKIKVQRRVGWGLGIFCLGFRAKVFG